MMHWVTGALESLKLLFFSQILNRTESFPWQMLITAGVLCFLLQVRGRVESRLLTICYIRFNWQVSFPSLYIRSTHFLSQNIFKHEYSIRDHNVTFILNSILFHNLVLDAARFFKISFSSLIGLISITSCVGLNVLYSTPEIIILLKVFQLPFQN